MASCSILGTLPSSNGSIVQYFGVLPSSIGSIAVFWALFVSILGPFRQRSGSIAQNFWSPCQAVSAVSCSILRQLPSTIGSIVQYFGHPAKQYSQYHAVFWAACQAALAVLCSVLGALPSSVNSIASMLQYFGHFLAVFWGLFSSTWQYFAELLQC